MKKRLQNERLYTFCLLRIYIYSYIQSLKIYETFPIIFIFLYFKNNKNTDVTFHTKVHILLLCSNDRIHYRMGVIGGQYSF